MTNQLAPAHVLGTLAAARRDANVANLTRLSDELGWILDQIDPALAERVEALVHSTQDRTDSSVDAFRAGLDTIAGVFLVDVLEEDETGDLAGQLFDAGIRVPLPLEELRVRNLRAHERDRLLAAAIPNRSTGASYGTTRLRVTYRVPNVGDRHSYDETIDLDVVGISARVMGFGGGALVGMADELPVRVIPTSTILSIEPLPAR